MERNKVVKSNQEDPITEGKPDSNAPREEVKKIKLPKNLKWEIIGYVVATVIVEATILLALKLPGDKLISGGTFIRYFIVYFIVETYYRKDVNTKYAKSKNLILITFGVFFIQLILGEILGELIMGLITL
jgi:hypothetical protein